MEVKINLKLNKLNSYNLNYRFNLPNLLKIRMKLMKKNQQKNSYYLIKMTRLYLYLDLITLSEDSQFG